MPELPEVETTAAYLREHVVGSKIDRVAIKPRGQGHFNLDPAAAVNSLLGKNITRIGRHGKWLLFEFEDVFAVAHLRMSGRFIVEPTESEHAHASYSLGLSSGKFVNYIDQRRFGTFHFTDSIPEYLSARKLGPDALSNEFLLDDLVTSLGSTSRAVYSALLDQRIVAGLGNIYVNEALHASGIHPQSKSNKLTTSQISALFSSIKRILQLALSLKGTSLTDNLYLSPEGSSGEFYKLLKVYGKKSDPKIQVLKIGGRSVFVHKDTKLQA